MTARTPARASSQTRGVIDFANDNLVRSGLDLRMAFQAKVIIAFDQEFLVDRTVRAMTGRAAFAKRRVFINKRARLFSMTLGAGLIESCHSESTRGFHDVPPMRIVTLHAVDPVFDDGMVVWQIKFGMRFEVALITTGRIFSGINDEFTSTASGRYVFAAWAVTGLTTSHARPFQILFVKTAMGTSGENARDIGMAFDTSPVPYEIRPCNFRRRDDRSV